MGQGSRCGTASSRRRRGRPRAAEEGAGWGSDRRIPEDLRESSWWLGEAESHQALTPRRRVFRAVGGGDEAGSHRAPMQRGLRGWGSRRRARTAEASRVEDGGGGRLMNEYLAVLRSLMPESYVHRGDQASIVGGAIDFVKELEQLLQSLEAKKRTLLMQQHKANCDAMPMPSTTSTVMNAGVDTTSNCSSDSGASEAAAAGDPAGTPFVQFFTYPQYVWYHPPRDGGGGAENRAGVADIEVNLVETHASLRVMAPRRPGQLLGMVTGLQALRLTILHLNVTALDSLTLYSLSVKVEEGCGLTTVDDIAAAVHHVLCVIDAEATSQRLLAEGAAGALVS